MIFLIAPILNKTPKRNIQQHIHKTVFTYQINAKVPNNNRQNRRSHPMKYFIKRFTSHSKTYHRTELNLQKHLAKKAISHHFTLQWHQPRTNLRIRFFYTATHNNQNPRLASHPLRSQFLRDIVQIQYLANFLKHTPKSFHCSFEVVSRRSQQHVYSIPKDTLIKVAA